MNGNLPNILNRIGAHNRAMFAVLPAGLARSHRASPAAALRVQLLYGVPVLLSGLAALVLLKSEIDILRHHYKLCLERLQKLHKATPEPVVYFLGGSLPLPALLHLRQLSLLGMIARLGSNNILHQHAKNILSSSGGKSHSWFYQIRITCSQYKLPDPVAILTEPPLKAPFKKLAKAKIVEAANLPSLVYFKTEFYSLTSPHPLWSTSKGNPYEVEKACVQAKMLSGRYRTCWLSRHWSGDPTGSCTLPVCRETAPKPGTLHHIIFECPDLTAPRSRVLQLWRDHLNDKPELYSLVQLYTIDCPDPSTSLQFILDCSVLPLVISQAQERDSQVLSSLFYITRTLCYSIHKARLKLLGKWKTI